jgi:hypothetical protein
VCALWWKAGLFWVQVHFDACALLLRYSQPFPTRFFVCLKKNAFRRQEEEGLASVRDISWQQSL